MNPNYEALRLLILGNVIDIHQPGSLTEQTLKDAGQHIMLLAANIQRRDILAKKEEDRKSSADLQQTTESPAEENPK